jgi:inosine-uridine nucleoside N-ribohydrolase
MKKKTRLLLQMFAVMVLILGCSDTNKIALIFDTDANNEIDDQHALAYLFYNSDIFDIKGITVNATVNGGPIEEHYEEAKRIMQLCGWFSKTPLISGANGNYNTIEKEITSADFDGHKAVEFIIKEALEYNPKDKLIVLAVGKLTNVALAIKKEPLIIPNIRVVWLGSNYPDPGEYNLENDILSMNHLLETEVEFEIVTVGYGKLTGTDVVKVTKAEVDNKIYNLGNSIETPVIGRHGGQFFSFGHYAKSLFENITYYGKPPSRSLFDMAAVAILKNPSWAKSKVIPSPLMLDGKWVQKEDNPRKIKLWEHFEKDAILKDFYRSLTPD